MFRTCPRCREVYPSHATFYLAVRGSNIQHICPACHQTLEADAVENEDAGILADQSRNPDLIDMRAFARQCCGMRSVR